MAAKKTTPDFKLKERQVPALEELVEAGKTGLAPSTWNVAGRFPTRTLQAFEAAGLAKCKDKKNGEGVKETFWFPTAKAPKTLSRASD